METIADQRRDRLRQWLSSGEARLEPLTFPQRELWEAAPYPAADVSNHICAVATIHGAVSRELCEAALGEVVARQEVLRLSVLPGKQGAVQLVRNEGCAVLAFRDAGVEGASPEAIDDAAKELVRRPFDLVGGPLYRVEILRLSAYEHVLILVIHHAIADGWTLGVFMRELWMAYAAKLLGVREAGAAPALPYSAWGAGERGFWNPSELGRRGAFWRSTLEGAGRILDSDGCGSGARARLVSRIPAELGQGLRELALRGGATLFSTVLGAFALALSKWTGKHDFVVGTPVANRNKRALWNTMGYFAGIVPMRLAVDPRAPAGVHLREAHRVAVDSLANAMPFVELVRALGAPALPGRNPVFDVRFALQNHPVPDVSLPGLAVEYRTRSTGTARFDLACELTEDDGGIEVVWLFREDLLSPAEARVLDRHYGNIIRSLCASTDESVATLMECTP